ncbi:MAG: type II toxin-antitoxin system ParD family antitoxin [Deltaproteobacteria bacterium]|nr:type II toxin-antitoxin system ParD family antitoxin [Deltaproteobacteria bacterium]
MSMQRKTITVTPQQDMWIKSQIESGEYGNDSEYLRDLIRLDQAKKNKLAQLRSALVEGEESGISQRSMADILTDAKKRHGVNV